MISNKFILDILVLLIDEFREERRLRKQIEFLTDSDYTYTGRGLIVTFTHQAEIQEWRVNMDGVLNGVEIRSNELKYGAEASLYFHEGIIAYLDIFSRSGCYPESELSDYTLVQSWKS